VYGIYFDGRLLLGNIEFCSLFFSAFETTISLKFLLRTFRLSIVLFELMIPVAFTFQLCHMLLFDSIHLKVICNGI